MTAIESWTFPEGQGVPSAGTYAHATAHSDVLYVSGQLGIDPITNHLVRGGIVEQTRQALDNLAKVLELCGSSMEHMLHARAFFLSFEEDFAQFNEAYRAYFPGRLPSRTTVVVSGFPVLDALVEIDVVAAR